MKKITTIHQVSNIFHSRFAWIASMAFFAITSCSIYGPTYKKPDIKILKQWQSKDQLSRLSTDNLPMMAWWQRFNDAQLNALITKAVARNNNIYAAVGNTIAAKGELSQIQFSWIPSVNALIFGYASTNVDLISPGYSSGFLPTYALNLFQFIRSTEWAKAKYEAAKASKDAVTLTIISQTTAGYFAYLGQTQLLRQQKQLVLDLKTLLALSRIQYQRGLISLYALQQYEQQYEEANTELPIIANNVVIARNTLKLLLNENPGKIDTHTSLMQLKSDGIIPTNLPSQVLRNRPDVRMAEQQLIAANANVGIVTSTFFPTISLTGVAASGSRQLHQLFSSNTDYWHHLSLVDVPVIDPEFIGQYQSAKGARYTALRQYIQAVRSAFKSVDNDLSAHQQYYASLKAQEKNFTSSQTAYTLANKSYHHGLYSYPTLLNNKINLDRAAIHLTQSKLAQLNTIVQLYEDLGGGYAYHSTKHI